MDRSWIIVLGMVFAVPLGVVTALGMDRLPFSAQLRDEGPAIDVQFVHVVDGDTIIVSREGQEERVRVLGIDAPDVAREGETGEPCSAEATALTEELTVGGGDVTITPDLSQAETDRYGRTLAYVEVDGEDVGAALLGAGLAEVYRSAPHIDRFATYEGLEARAQDPACEGS